MTIRTSYLQSIFEIDLFSSTVNTTVIAAEAIKKKHNFDTIAFSGMSGAMMAPILSHWLNVPMLCIRKFDDVSHYTLGHLSPLEGHIDTRRYMIVDDFISTGNTINRIITSISRETPSAQCVAILMYANHMNSIHNHPSHKEPIKVFTSNPNAYNPTKESMNDSQ